MRLAAVDAADEMLAALAGVDDPEEKRRIIAPALCASLSGRRPTWASSSTWPRGRSTPT